MKRKMAAVHYIDTDDVEAYQNDCIDIGALDEVEISLEEMTAIMALIKESKNQHEAFVKVFCYGVLRGMKIA